MSSKNKISTVDFKRFTEERLERIKKMDKIPEDADKGRRVGMQECVICYYGMAVAGKAITYRDCENCGVEMQFTNTCTDRLCLDCARKLKVCRHCAADIDLKMTSA